MKKMLFAFLAILNILIFFVSCSNDEPDYEDPNLNPQNLALVGSKWTLKNWDYSIGDDYIGIHDYTINMYFYSNTEGLVYYGKKDNYSDTGSSSYRAVAHFNFNVSGDNIKLEYTTNKIPEASFPSLTIKGDYIITDGFEFQRNNISQDDYAWLATLHGNTGECVWYHDLQNTLYIVGKGKMADYTSFDTTPWAKRAFNVLKVSDGVTSIGNNAFASRSLGEVKLPYSSLVYIGSNAFSGSCISEIQLSNNIKEIGNNAFGNCLYLNKIYLPENIEYIGEWAFSNCKSASLIDTKKLREIGKYAFYDCDVNYFTDSEVLEIVGDCAFTSLSVTKLTLPNSLKKIGHLSFNGSFTEIHIGTGLSDVTGTPFYPSKTGKIYVNISKPLALTNDFLDPASGWTLYVPKGCRSAYSQASYWKNFKSIIEDANLDSDNEQPNEDNEDNNEDDWGNNDDITIPQTYSNAGNTFKWIRVESTTMPTFYIMQTELDPNSHFRVGDNGDIGLLNTNGGVGITKAQMQNFLNKIFQVTGIHMRMPTREEWKYAAKGGNKSKGYTYSGSNDIDQVAWYSKNSNNKLHEFATKQPNELDLYDMSGNYAELTNDNIEDYANVDGYYYGGCFSDTSSGCTTTSGKPGLMSGTIPGSNYKEKNAYDNRKITVRLVFTAPY